jgi:hypothetical protein
MSSKDQTPKENGPRLMKYDVYLFRGKKLKKEEAVKYPILAAGDGLPQEDVIHAFGSQDEFAKWIQNTEHSSNVQKALQTIEHVKTFKEDHADARHRQRKLVKRVQEDLDELSTRMGLPLSSPALLTRASIDSPILEGRILNTCILWELSGGRGAALPTFGIPYPDLGWFGWSDRAVSVSVNGFMVLCDGIWYGGQSVWLFGLFWPLFELGAFSFRASSVYGT